jgi:hypothetical protein
VFCELPSAARDAKDSRREKCIAKVVENGQRLEMLIDSNNDEGVGQC